MRLRLQLLLTSVIAAGLWAPPALAKDKGPQWSRDEIRRIFAQIQNAARAPSVQAKDMGIAQTAGTAYKITAKPGENVEAYSKRILRSRRPDYPNVKKGQWLTALTQHLYKDLSKRCQFVARFETKRDSRRYFESMAQQTAQVAKQLESQLVLVVDGLEKGTEPLPAVGGAPSTEIGVQARVHSGGVVTVQRLDRVRFEGHQPPDDRPRTKTGALKELYSSQKQFNQFAQTIGKYDRAHRETIGHVQVLIPASYPAIYLNEITRAAVEAGMHTLHLKTMTKRGELRQLNLALNKQSSKKRRRSKKRRAKYVKMTCDDQQLMSKCAARLKRAEDKGTVLFQAS